MSFRSACARNGPPARLQAQLNSTHRCAHCKVRCFACTRESPKKHPSPRCQLNSRMLFLQLGRVAPLSPLHLWNMFYVIVPLTADKFKETALNFNTSPGLPSLRFRRRTTANPGKKRLLNLENRKRQRPEIEVWKTERAV